MSVGWGRKAAGLVGVDRRCNGDVGDHANADDAHEPLLSAARASAAQPRWQAEYHRHRPMVERSIAWLTRNNRKVRYRGVAKNNHWLHHRTAAPNLRRLLAMGLTHTGTTWAIA
jgi:hypothetical protein